MNRHSGFTLIELAVALSIAVVIAGLVIARVDGWSGRQSLRTSARALGNTIRLYREKAQEDEEVYTFRMDLGRGTYDVTAAGLILRRGKLGPGQSFGKARSGELELSDPVVLNLGPRGIVPEASVELRGGEKDLILVKVAATANEVSYEEPK